MGSGGGGTALRQVLVRSRLALAAIIALAAGSAGAEDALRRPSPGTGATRPHSTPLLPATRPIPRFEDFPAPVGPPARNAPLVLTPRDMEYRTRLRAAATERPNFAGHYVLAKWGCGVECIMGAAINARTGRVTFLPFYTCCYSEAGEGHSELVAFRQDSALLVLLGMRDGRVTDIGAHYYRIEGDRLVHLRSVPFPARR